MTSSKKGRLRVEYVPIKSVKPAKGNARLHPPDQVAALAAMMREHGWTQPIVVDERREILAGHGRLQAAYQNGETEVPILTRTGLSQAQKRAYRLADNKIGERSAWDTKLLGTELKALADMGFDMTLTGFDSGEIADFLRPPPSQHGEPPVPALQKPAVSALGDVWLMGEHRLICGNNEKKATLAALMNGRQAAMVFTDPPYGVSYEARSGKFEVITGDGLRRGQLSKMLHSAFSTAIEHVRPDAGWYVWHASSTREDFASAMRDVGLIELGYIFWSKSGAVLGWSDYRWAHEPCFYAARQGTKPAFYGDRSHVTNWRVGFVNAEGELEMAIGQGLVIALPSGEEIYIGPVPKGRKLRHIQLQPDQRALLQTSDELDNVWEVSRDSGHGKEESIHPTQKPVELARRAIANSSREGEIVLDFYAGSGSTLIGAEQLGRACYAAELEPPHVDAIVRRWQTLTGKQATHEKDGKTFEAITRSRTGKAKARAA